MQQNVPRICFAIVLLLCSLQEGISEASSSTAGRKSFWGKTKALFPFAKRTKQNKDNDNENMGQAVRIMKYDRAENERNAIPALTLNLLNQEAAPLKWHRLDDGVMGGQSETLHTCLKDGGLHFTGQINTNGGGFCSIRSPLPDGGLPKGTTGVRLRVKGDGKTYKFLLSDRSKSKFGPSRRSPSWQGDIPTQKSSGEQEITIPFSSLKPSFGPSPISSDDVQFDASAMGEIGFMLSLQLSDGSSNPVETFGSGIFPFSFQISSIEPIVGDTELN